MTKEFNLGRIVLTKTVDAKMKSDPAFQRFVTLSLGKHIRNNWGNVSPEDRQRNDEAVNDGGRIHSVYYRPGMKKDEPERAIWIITEADRSATTIIFPDEY